MATDYEAAVEGSGLGARGSRLGEEETWSHEAGPGTVGTVLVVNALGITILPDGAKASEFWPWTSVRYTEAVPREDQA